MKRPPVILVLASLVLLVAIGGAVVVDAAQEGRIALTQGSATETEWDFDAGCQSGCRGLVEWWELVLAEGQDRVQVIGALFLAYESTAGWRPFAREAVKHRTPIVPFDLDAVGRGNALGMYIRDDNLILIEEELLADALDVLASVLAHEIVHATQRPGFWDGLFDGDDERSRGECLEHEYEAVRWEIEVFSNTPEYDHNSDSFAWEIVRRREALQSGSLIAAVADLYTDNCGFE